MGLYSVHSEMTTNEHVICGNGPTVAPYTYDGITAAPYILSYNQNLQIHFSLAFDMQMAIPRMQCRYITHTSIMAAIPIINKYDNWQLSVLKISNPDGVITGSINIEMAMVPLLSEVVSGLIYIGGYVQWVVNSESYDRLLPY